jgi:homocysteine S-methyltransferase
LLAAAGPDALLLETFNSVREAAAAAGAAAATSLPVIVSFTCAAGGMLLSGEPVREAVRAVTVPGVVAVGVNCTRRDDTLDALREVARVTELPLVAYANDGWYDSESLFLEAEPSTPETFARAACDWAAAGARLIGGCCGTSPAHTAAIRRTLDRRPRGPAGAATS